MLKEIKSRMVAHLKVYRDEVDKDFLFSVFGWGNFDKSGNNLDSDAVISEMAKLRKEARMPNPITGRYE